MTRPYRRSLVGSSFFKLYLIGGDRVFLDSKETARYSYQTQKNLPQLTLRKVFCEAPDQIRLLFEGHNIFRLLA